MFYTNMIAHAVEKESSTDLTFEDFIEHNSYIKEKNLLFTYYSMDTIDSKQAAERLVAFSSYKARCWCYTK